MRKCLASTLAAGTSCTGSRSSSSRLVEVGVLILIVVGAAAAAANPYRYTSPQSTEGWLEISNKGKVRQETIRLLELNSEQCVASSGLFARL